MLHFSNEVWEVSWHLGVIVAMLWVVINVAGLVWVAGSNYVNENTEATNFCPWGKRLHINDQADLVCATFCFAVLACVLPFIVLGLISIYPVPLFILTTYGVLRAARGAKRLSRKLTSHTIDPEAHKNA